MTLKTRCLVGCGFLLLLPSPCFCGDWPQWRGPDRDGRIVDAPKSWPEELDQSWQVEVGEGHSSPVIVGKYAYIFTRQADNEVVRRLELDTGKVVWSKKCPVQGQRQGNLGASGVHWVTPTDQGPNQFDLLQISADCEP